MSRVVILLISVVACISCVDVLAFTTSLQLTTSRSVPLSMAGFGGGATSSKKQKKKKGATLPKLKAKSQWDRYNSKELKTCQKITVGVRIKGGDVANDWLEVGRVRSANDEYTEIAVARQRALIAEHSKRLYPVQISANAILEWGYIDGEDWKVMEKSNDDAPNGIEKQIGFEGISDKASGFYCYYHEGRVVEKEEEGMGTRGSGFKAIKGK